MSRQRYEAVAQDDETIILDNIHSQHYNYNSGIPTSVASSHYAPSTTGYPPASTSNSASTPTSPPPSFHSISVPSTPRPTPSTHTNLSSAPSYNELWGVAPSTISGIRGGDGEPSTSTITTSNDALATIAGLKQRIEWLEESIGRLLIEKDALQSQSSTDKKDEGNNCCVWFSDLSPDVERALTSGKSTNCCVRLGSKGEPRRNRGPVFLFALILVVCVMVTVVSVANAGARKAEWQSGRGEKTMVVLGDGEGGDGETVRF